MYHRRCSVTVNWEQLFIRDAHEFNPQHGFRNPICKITSIPPMQGPLSNEFKFEVNIFNAWWPHQMETFSTLLALCAGNSPLTGESPSQRPVTRSFDVFFDLRLNKRLNKQSWGWWFETPSRSLWRYRNDFLRYQLDDSCLSATIWVRLNFKCQVRAPYTLQMLLVPLSARPSSGIMLTTVKHSISRFVWLSILWWWW